jgi:hypothetical protein
MNLYEEAQCANDGEWIINDVEVACSLGRSQGMPVSCMTQPRLPIAVSLSRQQLDIQLSDLRKSGQTTRQEDGASDGLAGRRWTLL